MGTIKTLVNDASVSDFINAVPDEIKRKDSFSLVTLFEKVTGEKAKMWGPSIIGFGSYHYKSERSTQEGDWLKIGFSPRKQNLTLYITPTFAGFEELIGRLGKCKTSGGCLYIKKLSDVDLTILEKIISLSFTAKKIYGSS